MEVAEYDSSTDEEGEVESGGSHIPELDRRSTFPTGNYLMFWGTNQNQQQTCDVRVLIFQSITNTIQRAEMANRSFKFTEVCY